MYERFLILLHVTLDIPHCSCCAQTSCLPCPVNDRCHWEPNFVFIMRNMFPEDLCCSQRHTCNTSGKHQGSSLGCSWVFCKSWELQSTLWRSSPGIHLWGTLTPAVGLCGAWTNHLSRPAYWDVYTQNRPFHQCTISGFWKQPWPLRKRSQN